MFVEGTGGGSSLAFDEHRHIISTSSSNCAIQRFLAESYDLFHLVIGKDFQMQYWLDTLTDAAAIPDENCWFPR